VDFKIAILVYRLLSGMAPAYLAADSQLSSEEGRRRSAAFCRLEDLYRQALRRTYSSFGTDVSRLPAQGC